MSKILVVDDQRDARRLLVRLIGYGGHQLFEAADGAEALDLLLRRDAPRLDVLDWMMPGLDGLEVVRRVRQRAGAVPPYSILLTARGEVSDIDEPSPAGLRPAGGEDRA